MVFGGVDLFICLLNLNCNCYNQFGILFVNCVYQDLIEVLLFSDDVIGIIFVYNEILKFLIFFFKNIIYLDLLDNLIDRID